MQLYFVRVRDVFRIFIFVYIDDILLFARTEAEIEETISMLQEYYRIRDLCDVSRFQNTYLPWNDEEETFTLQYLLLRSSLSLYFWRSIKLLVAPRPILQ